jgi:hypothetical protein
MPINHKQHDVKNDIANLWMNFVFNEYKEPLTKSYKYGVCGNYNCNYSGNLSNFPCGNLWNK